MLPLQTGTLINGRYRLLGRVAQVADAERWIGEDTTLRRKVDLWITASDHPRAAAAQDAARRAALVEDARLPRVLDIGVEDGLQWLITQHDPRARTLLELVETAPLPPAEARRLVGEAAQALEGARRHGVHHEALAPELLLRDADGGVLVKGLGIAAALTGADTGGADAAAERDTKDLVALLRAGLTGRWPAAGRPSEVAEAVPYELDELCAQLDHEGSLELDGEPVRTPGDLVSVLAPWNSGTVSGRGVVRPAPAAPSGGSDDTTQAMPTTRGEVAPDAPTTAIPTEREGAASVDGPASAAAVAGSAPGAAGLTDPAAAVPAADGSGGDGIDGERTDGGEDVREDGDTPGREDAAGAPGRKQLLLAGAGSLAVAGALALAAVALPGLFSDDDAPDDTAAPSVSAPAADGSGNPASPDDPTSADEGDDEASGGPGEENSGAGADESADAGADGDEAVGTPDEATDPAPDGDGATGSDAAEGEGPGDESAAPTSGSEDGNDDASEEGAAPVPGGDGPTAPDQGPSGSSEAGSSEDDSDESSSGSGTSEDATEESDTAETDTPGDGPDSSAPDGGWPIADIVGYDPGHDGDEHTDWTPRINNPNTDLPWSTHKYKHRPFGGYTDALGLRIDLGELREVSAVDIGAPRGDWEYEIRVGPSEDILRAVTIGSHRGGGDVTLEADQPAQGRFVFVWFTDTAPTGDGWWYAQLEDITVR
ncbi:hypothetical protein [Kytococcus sedentarius]|uniref:hypothetical protein n=1 Tax=Kytococcus sedentarius TaxID=1276 RepID=UPI001951DAA6|nr:hypothetical protein [Kytococcus sedentarius]QRO87287.1 hypothetical protein I6J30_10840 [Kytococcus sedentarius]